jgi:cyclopropane fatty-acyl-phospholipid synthase-like methyltransferase
MSDTTLAYYTAHWKDLIQRYESADVTELQVLLTAGSPPPPPGARLLELGCGSGRDAAYMLASGFDVISCTVTSDGLGRGSFAWLNCLAAARRK